MKAKAYSLRAGINGSTELAEVPAPTQRVGKFPYGRALRPPASAFTDSKSLNLGYAKEQGFPTHDYYSSLLSIVQYTLRFLISDCGFTNADSRMVSSTFKQ